MTALVTENTIKHCYNEQVLHCISPGKSCNDLQICLAHMQPMCYV